MSARTPVAAISRAERVRREFGYGPRASAARAALDSLLTERDSLVAALDQAVEALDVATDALAAGTKMPDRAALTAKLATLTHELRVAVSEVIGGADGR